MNEELSLHIKSSQIPIDELKQKLVPYAANEADLRWEVKKQSRFRADPVTIAIIGATGAAIGAFITGLLKVVAETEKQKIVVSDKAGNKIEVPVAVMNDIEKIEEIAKMLRRIDSPTIHL